jgi:hypothetical protein
MKAIVSLKKDDGTYHEVGMNNRTVIGPYKGEGSIYKLATAWAKGKGHRIEFFMGDSILGPPYRTEFR